MFKVSYNRDCDKSYFIRGTLIEAVKLMDRLKRQGFDVVLSNAETGFIINPGNKGA